MSQLAPSAAHKRFAGQVAWERGKKILNWPTTSSALSGLIQQLIRDHTPLPAAEWQVERFRRLVTDCVAKVSDFDAGAFSEVPSDRASANKAIFALERLLNRTDFRAAASGDISQYVVDADSPEATAANVEQHVAESSATPAADDEIPF